MRNLKDLPMLRALMAFFLVMMFAAPAANAEGAPPLDQSTAWFYLAGNQTQGPYSLSEMENLTRQGVIRPSTQVHHPVTGWAFAKDIPELQGLLSEVAPPPPPPGIPVPTPPSYPPDVSGAANDPAREIEAFLVGRWRTVARQEMGGQQFETTLEFDFRADGSYGGYISTRMPESPDLQPLTEQMRGTWSILLLDAKSFVLTTDTGIGQPEQVALDIADDATMISSDGRSRYIRVR